jgi:ABC-type phosphate transport system substrate-binding protein
MRSKPTRVAVAIVLAGVAALAAGCGGGGSKSPSTTSSSSPPTTNSATTSSSAGSGSSFASAKNCQDLAGIAAKAAAAVAA